MAIVILQWDCRGIRANFTALHLIAVTNPIAVCLQETQLSSDCTLSFKNVTIFNTFGRSDKRVSGGTAILIRNYVIHSHINIKSNLRVTLQKTIKAV